MKVNKLDSVILIDSQSRLARATSWLFSRRKTIVLLLMLVFIAAFSLLTLTKPVYEWDLFAYLGNAIQVGQDLPLAELHKNVYSLVKDSVSPEVYSRLIGSPSRLVLSQDPEAYRQTIAFFYDARIVYNHLMSFLLKAGLNPVFSFYFFSTFCAVVSLLLLLKLIPVTAPIGVHFVMPFIALSFGLLAVARLATPDAFATLVTILLYFMLLRNRVVLLLLLIPFVVFIRSDLILLIGLFHCYLLLGHRVSKVLVIGSGIATIVAYFALNNIIVEGDPWSSVIGYNLGEKPTYVATYVFPITVNDYFGFLWSGLQQISYSPIVTVFFMLTICGIALLSAPFFSSPRSIRLTQLHADLLFLFFSSGIYFFLHFIFFPEIWVRFFAAQYSMTSLVVCWCTFSLLSSHHRAPNGGLDFLKID